MKHSDAVSKLNHQHREKVMQLSNELKKKDQMIDDIHELAFDVSQEFHDVQKETTTIVSQQKQLADSRQARMKAAVEVNESLRDQLEQDQEYYHEIITDTYNQIEDLQCRLEESIARCDTLTLACDIAQQDIDVSLNAISFFSTATDSFISPINYRT